MSSAGEANTKVEDAVNSRGLKNGAALHTVTVFVQKSPPAVLARSNFSSSLHTYCKSKKTDKFYIILYSHKHATLWNKCSLTQDTQCSKFRETMYDLKNLVVVVSGMQLTIA